MGRLEACLENDQSTNAGRHSAVAIPAHQLDARGSVELDLPSASLGRTNHKPADHAATGCFDSVIADSSAGSR